MTITELVGFSKFEREGDGYFRYDFDNIGIGIGFTSSYTFVGSIVPLKGKSMWVNIYKRFPIPYRIGKFLAIRCDFVSAKFSKLVQVHYTGPRSTPYASFQLRIGHIFIGTATPNWLQRLECKRDPVWDSLDC